MLSHCATAALLPCRKAPQGTIDFGALDVELLNFPATLFPGGFLGDGFLLAKLEVVEKTQI